MKPTVDQLREIFESMTKDRNSLIHNATLLSSHVCKDMGHQLSKLVAKIDNIRFDIEEQLLEATEQ